MNPATNPLNNQFETLLPRKTITEEPHFDITAMIDLVFMMNIFFLVTSLTAALAQLDMPNAKNCMPSNADDCVVISMRPGVSQTTPMLWVGDGGEASGTTDENRQSELVREAAEKAVREKNGMVLVKAEKNVKLQDTARVSSTIASVEGTHVFFGVMELDLKD
jgi:biopolymer transport protein ExbD